MEGEFLVGYEIGKDSFEIYKHEDDDFYSVLHYHLGDEAESFTVTSYTRALEKILFKYREKSH